MKKLATLFLVLALLTVGCAFAAHKPVLIKPELSIEESTVGKNQEIWINVVDERTRKTLGTRGVRGIGTEITVEGDCTLALHNSLADGLSRQGFRPVDVRTSDDRELRVEIRNLDYNLIMGFWAGTLRTACGLKAFCIIGNTRPYENLYLGEFQKSVQVVQADEANQLYINSAISSAINSLLQDLQLMQCLAAPE